MLQKFNGSEVAAISVAAQPFSAIGVSIAAIYQYKKYQHLFLGHLQIKVNRIYFADEKN